MEICQRSLKGLSDDCVKLLVLRIINLSIRCQGIRNNNKETIWKKSNEKAIENLHLAELGLMALHPTIVLGEEIPTESIPGSDWFYIRHPRANCPSLPPNPNEVRSPQSQTQCPPPSVGRLLISHI